MQNLLDNEIAQTGGWFTVALSLSLSLIDWICQFPVNDILQSVASFGAIVFLWYKIRMIRLELKIKKRENEK